MRALVLLSLLSVAACAEDVAKDKTAAVVTEAPPAPVAPVAAPAAPAGPLTELAVDKTRSKIGALGAKITGSHDLSFSDFEGKLGVSGDTVSAVSFTVQVGSLVAEPEKLAGHLKSPDFFDVAAFPTASFASTEVKAATGGEATHEITGDLTLRGVTKRVTFPAKLTVTPGEVTGRAEFSINRKDFGIVYPGKPDDLIQDNVVLTIDLAAPRA